jgi:hypothetical protein
MYSKFKNSIKIMELYYGTAVSMTFGDGAVVSIIHSMTSISQDARSG